MIQEKCLYQTKRCVCVCDIDSCSLELPKALLLHFTSARSIAPTSAALQLALSSMGA